MATRPDDHHVIGSLRLGIAPLSLPALMGVEGLGDQRSQRKAAHAETLKLPVALSRETGWHTFTLATGSLVFATDLSRA